MTDFLTLAKEACQKAYAPYSNFHVGAVLESTDGRLYVGANIENVAFNPTLHAEGCALAAGMMDGTLERCGQNWIKTVFVYCPSAHKVAPCGYCRQTLREFIHPDAIWIGHCSKTNQTHSAPFRDLLPFDFGPAGLKEGQNPS